MAVQSYKIDYCLNALDMIERQVNADYITDGNEGCGFSYHSNECNDCRKLRESIYAEKYDELCRGNVFI